MDIPNRPYTDHQRSQLHQEIRRRCRSYAHGLARQFVGDGSLDGDDLLQRAYRVVDSHLDSLDDADTIESLVGFANGTLRNLARDARRKARRRRDIEETWLEPREVEDAQTPDEAAQLREIHDALRAEIDALPPDDRTLIEMRFDRDQPRKQVASAFRLRIGQCREREAAILAELRRRLSSRGLAAGS